MGQYNWPAGKGKAVESLDLAANARGHHYLLNRSSRSAGVAENSPLPVRASAASLFDRLRYPRLFANRTERRSSDLLRNHDVALRVFDRLVSSDAFPRQS